MAIRRMVFFFPFVFVFVFSSYNSSLTFGLVKCWNVSSYTHSCHFHFHFQMEDRQRWQFQLRRYWQIIYCKNTDWLRIVLCNRFEVKHKHSFMYVRVFIARHIKQKWCAKWMYAASFTSHDRSRCTTCWAEFQFF